MHSHNETKPTKIDIPLSIISPSSLLFFKPISTNHSNQKPIPNIQTLLTQTSHDIVSRIHDTVQECVGVVQKLALRNEFFSKVYHEYHNFCQINNRNRRSLNHLSKHNFAAVLPGDSLAGLVVTNGISNFLNIYNTLLVARLVLTWFPNAPPVIVSPLSTLCDPYLNIFRGLIPPLGGTLDLSPILAFLVLNALTSTASALPAELPSTETSQKDSSSESHPSSPTTTSHLTTSQKKWVRRFDASRSKGSTDN
ncbi:YGGT family protein [Artemisia annua]|uniref:YGGT family protein n=1 Tax=Artemisia annua TaxID=35608 RepID=A0A2U1MAP3_ARTAN|nr:YGGT family protein [Artemisia annua]